MQADLRLRTLDCYSQRTCRAWCALLGIVSICALLLALLDAAGAQAPAGYPDKPIRLLVPYGAGGVGDQTMRLLANTVSQQVGQQIVIENRPSAGGIISMSEALRAA